MVTIYKHEDNLGAQLGQALGTGLASLASHKIENIKNKHLEQRLVKDGFKPEMASLLVSIGPKAREKYFEDQFDYHKFENQPRRQPQQAQQPIQQQQFQQPQQQIRNNIQAQQPEQAPIQAVNPKAVPGNLQKLNKPTTADILRATTGQGPQDVFAGLNPQQQNMQPQGPQQQRQMQQQAPVGPQQTVQPVKELTPNERFGQAAAQKQLIEEAAQREQSLSRPKVDQLQQQKDLANYKEMIKQQHAEQVDARKNLEKSEKESKDWYQESNKRAKGIKEQVARLDKMEKLVQTGKLNLPGAVGILNALEHGIWGYGVNLKGALLSPESQEFEKLSNDMLSGIQDVFGSRILKTEVDNFLKTIPNLLQSDTGKLRVINNLKILNEAKLAQDKVAKEIVKENGGKVPFDLQTQVDERLEPILDEYHNRFVNEEAPKPKTSTYKKLFWSL